MPSAAIIIPISYNDGKSKNESISTVSDGQSFQPRGHRFCFVRDIFMPLFHPCWLAGPQGWSGEVFLLTVSLRPDATILEIHRSYCLCPSGEDTNKKYLKKKKPFKKQSYFCFFYCPGRCSLQRPTGVRINTRRTWHPLQRAETHRSV